MEADIVYMYGESQELADLARMITLIKAKREVKVDIERVTNVKWDLAEEKEKRKRVEKERRGRREGEGRE